MTYFKLFSPCWEDIAHWSLVVLTSCRAGLNAESIFKNIFQKIYHDLTDDTKQLVVNPFNAVKYQKIIHHREMKLSNYRLSSSHQRVISACPDLPQYTATTKYPQYF